MEAKTLIAFSEKSLNGASLAGIKTTRLSINGTVCKAIPMEDLGEVCGILGVTERQISKVKTNYRGVYLARFSNNGNVDVKRKSKKSPNDTLKRKYMELCGYNRKAERLRTLKHETSRLRSAVEKSQEQLVTLLRKMEEKQQQLTAVSGTDDAALARFGDEFNGLLKHPDIERIEVSGKNILVYTGPITIRYNRVDYEIGKFKITINTLGERGGVRMINRTNSASDGYGSRNHHPHVNHEGKPCLGNIQEVIPHMIAEHKYPAVIMVCIQYLKSYEKSSFYGPYSEISNWPVSEKKISKRKEKKE